MSKREVLQVVRANALSTAWFVLYREDAYATGMTYPQPVDAEHVSRDALLFFGVRPRSVWPDDSVPRRDVAPYFVALRGPRDASATPCTEEERAALRALTKKDRRRTREEVESSPRCGWPIREGRTHE